MPSTPPPVALRAHTPPTPLHGPQYDSYEPYSPRRSKRTTAQSNPYSSFNNSHSPNTNNARTTPPPTVVKKARFARQPTQLSSPPSSPASPRTQRRSPTKTPRKQARKPNGAASDSDGPPSLSTAPPTIDPTTMLPTPSKTPRKRSHAAAISSTARILSFQPNHPNDVMPSPRKIKKSHARSLLSQPGFELYEDDMGRANGGAGAEIEIYTDANARVPVLDESEDNPFVGAKQSQRRRERKRGRQSEADAEMEERVRREEGVVYVFRGKKIFRPFQDPNTTSDGNADDASNAATDLSNTPSQRRLKHAAGPSAQRPLTRSAIKPRLLFPSAEQLQERQPNADDVDEEAVTDIEMDDTHAEGGNANGGAGVGSLVSPPPTQKKKGRAALKASVDGTPFPIFEDEGEPMVLGTDESFSSTAGSGSGAGRRGKGKSPFDSWARTKGGRKRAGEAVEEVVGSGKRTRSSAAASPLG